MTEITKVLVAGEDPKVIQEVLKYLFDSNLSFDGEKALESDILLKSKYYECQLGIFADTLDAGETLDWIKELCMEDMRDLRDALQGVILIINPTWSLKSLNQLSEQLKELAYLLDDEYIEGNKEKEVLQWDGIKSVLIFDSKVSDREQELEKMYDIMDPSTFELTVINDINKNTLVASFKEFVQCIHSTDWRSIESISAPHEQSLTPPPGTNMEPLISNMIPIVNEIKKARGDVNINPEIAADLAKHFARKVSLLESTPSLSN